IAAGNECLIVGDVKQSIYRWRGGNMHLLATQVVKDLQHFDGLITTKQLNTNYRSAENIVSFNNFLFGASAFVLQNEVENTTLELIKSTYGEDFVTQQLSPT
ncbi:MAG TPA: UvrD-helicase domain-containing protein, partial [Bacteroidia bacterium]|nr:UvrD-helicase domain-containing protein [Bacteroidia bacterium]